MKLLGIESSCDETAAAVIVGPNRILSSVISSQIEMHRPFGGVVPEAASREHLSKIDAIVAEALKKAAIEESEIDAVAVTKGPGLIGSLLVGVCYAKAFALGLQKPLIGVNHIEGHFYSVVFENPPIEYPALALIVSGGHTNLFFVPRENMYKLISQTRDDAAGEAFDKVAKLLGLAYPGGPIIEKVARGGDPLAIRFTRPKITDGTPDFSFSGLKTAVTRYVREMGIEPMSSGQAPVKRISDLAASFQQTVVSMLVDTMEEQAASLKPKTLIVAGGVACNLVLRAAAESAAKRLGIPVYFPSKHLSTDNAAMIAAAGYRRLIRGEIDGPEMTADTTIRLARRPDTRRVRYKI
ncbi:MAG: tRNA (adenosine(37)-N6)-threonylcarbamoyltransferase complex transferase subunit TsaD [Blastocatellia bacterium]